jgi:RNA polymerase sigma factor (sigma-70 family)
MVKETIVGLLKVSKIEKSRDHEEIFLDHYDWLLKNARDLCHGSREEADDLVQDLYVGFVQSKSAVQVDDADRLRGYLYKALKNLFIRKNRRNRDAAASLDISDFDSIQIALSSVDGSQLLLVRSRLTEICEYACARRTTHKAGSVLILRFFFGYYPSEIAQLLKTNRAAVDKLTHTARLEAKAYLTRPRTLQFSHQQQHGEQISNDPTLREKSVPCVPEQRGNLPDDPAELKAELRERILSMAEGDCLPREVIVARYAEQAETTLSTNELAHLVSCRTCLDTANDILGIPSLDMHFSSDDSEPNDQDPPSASAGRRRDRARQRLRRKQREAFEHRPAQLQVAVNGQVLGTTAITGEFNEFQLINLDMISHPEFVEVLSEQGITLGSLDLLEVDGDGIPIQRTHVELSDGRDLSIEITWSGSGPGVNVSYRDLPDDDSATGTTADGPTLSEVEIRAIAKPPASMPKVTPWKRFASWLASHWMMPISVVAVGVLVLSAGVYLHYSHTKTPTPPPIPATLLFDSSKTEEAAIPAHGAMHRTFAFEVRSDQGKILESGTIDSLRGKTPSRRALRLLNQHGKLIAGHWVSEAGKVTDQAFEHSAQPPAKDPRSEMPMLWIHLPEADDFDALSGPNATLSAKLVSDGYEIDLSASSRNEEPTVIAASLTLTKETRRPIKEIFRVADRHSTREYRFEELTYEYLPASPQLESDFTPPAEGLAIGGTAKGGYNSENSDAHITLEALTLLSNLGPDVERIVNIERTLNGGTSIDGVLGTSIQRAEVARVFAPLRYNHNLVVDLHASDELVSEPVPLPKPQLQALDEIPVENERVPLDAELRSSLTTSGVPDSDLDDRIHAIASGALEHCSLLKRDAWSIRQIATVDFTASELQQMTPEDQMLWLTLLDRHIRAFEGDRTELKGTLHALLDAENSRASATPAKAPGTITSVAELRDATQTLNQDSEHLERILTAGLTLSQTSPPDSSNPEVVAQLMFTLEVQESRLHEIVEHLQTLEQR